MKFTQATDYAVRAVMYLARLPKDTTVEAAEIARGQGIPRGFLLKILRSLAAAGVVGSQRGAGGGFVLRRDPAEITLLDIVQAVEGRTAASRCLIDTDFCSRRGAHHCAIRRAVSSVERVLTAELARHDIATLTSGEYGPPDRPQL